MRIALLTLALIGAPALAEEPASPAATTDASTSTAPLQGEIRFHVEGMKPSGDGF